MTFFEWRFQVAVQGPVFTQIGEIIYHYSSVLEGCHGMLLCLPRKRSHVRGTCPEGRFAWPRKQGCVKGLWI